MNSQDKWNYIVQSQYENYTKAECDIQKSWEEIFSEFFDYKKLCGEIATQTQIQLGSHYRLIPDIVLKKDKKALVDIELKQYKLPFDISFENQLVSYLKQLDLSIGVIICNKIYVYSFAYPNKIDRIEIPFEKDNARGTAFVELFNKNEFSETKVKEFIFAEKEKEKKEKEKTRIKEEVKTKLNSEYIKNCVCDKLLLNYPADIVDDVLKNISFSCIDNAKAVAKEGAFTEENLPQPDQFAETGDFIIIKTSSNRVNSCRGSLYDATRHCWRVSYDKVIQYKYVLAVIDGYVKEVYRVDAWQQARQWDNDFKPASDRYEFAGSVAAESIRQKWLGKQIPEHYRKKGMASPVIFSKPFASEKHT